MKVTYLNDRNHNVEAQIARGGFSIKLYNDLEITLSTLIAKSKNILVEIDLLLLSNRIVETILGVSDPISGKVDMVKKEKAERQINLITLLNKNNIMPISLYEITKLIKSTGSKYNILSSNDKLKLQNLIMDFKISLDHLEDLNEFKKLKRKVDDLSENFSIVMDLIMAEKGAQVIDRHDSLKSKEILNHVKNIAKYYLQKKSCFS